MWLRRYVTSADWLGSRDRLYMLQLCMNNYPECAFIAGIKQCLCICVCMCHTCMCLMAQWIAPLVFYQCTLSSYCGRAATIQIFHCRFYSYECCPQRWQIRWSQSKMEHNNPTWVYQQCNSVQSISWQRLHTPKYTADWWSYSEWSPLWYHVQL